MNKEVRAYLSMGSNIGNKMYYLIEGLIRIGSLEDVKLTKVSSFYETEPWGYLEQDSFYNIAVEIRTKLLPFDLLKKLQKIEKELHRKRDLRWGPRTLDIDIIFYDNLSIKNGDLILPHPRYQDRKFVLAPLYEVYNNREILLKYLIKDSSKIEKIVPKVLVGSCLLGDDCTYRGDNNKRSVLDVIKGLEYIKICPEVEGGLATPRPPAEILKDKVITVDGSDVTKEFELGARKTLEVALENNCILAIMKAKSPSCGYEKIYDGTFTGTLTSGNGITVEELIKNNIGIVIL